MRFGSKKLLPDLFQLTIRYIFEKSPFLPLLLGALGSEWRPLPKRAAALWEGPARFGRNRESRSREVRFLHPGYGTAGVGILPKQRPSKCAAEKGQNVPRRFIRFPKT
jgi:hypothetical protein